MPLLPSSFLSVKDHLFAGQLIVNGKSSASDVIEVFKCCMLLTSGCATLITRADCECPFVLCSDRGILEPSSEDFRMPLKFDEEIKVVHFICEGQVQVYGLAVSNVGRRRSYIVDFIALLPGLRGDDPLVTSSSMTCVDVDCSKVDDADDQFYFSCSLVFVNLPDTRASTEVSCCVPGCDGTAVLGASYCGRYRVHKLLVPYPMYGGPDNAILFKASHLCRAGLKVGESKLRVFYAENS